MIFTHVLLYLHVLECTESLGSACSERLRILPHDAKLYFVVIFILDKIPHTTVHYSITSWIRMLKYKFEMIIIAGLKCIRGSPPQTSVATIVPFTWLGYATCNRLPSSQRLRLFSQDNLGLTHFFKKHLQQIKCYLCILENIFILFINIFGDVSKTSLNSNPKHFVFSGLMIAS